MTTDPRSFAQRMDGEGVTLPVHLQAGVDLGTAAYLQVKSRNGPL